MAKFTRPSLHSSLYFSYRLSPLPFVYPVSDSHSSSPCLSYFPPHPFRYIPRLLIIVKNYINIRFCSSTDLSSALLLSIRSVGHPYLDPNLISFSGNPLHFTQGLASIAAEPLTKSTP